MDLGKSFIRGVTLLLRLRRVLSLLFFFLVFFFGREREIQNTYFKQCWALGYSTSSLFCANS